MRRKKIAFRENARNLRNVTFFVAHLCENLAIQTDIENGKYIIITKYQHVFRFLLSFIDQTLQFEYEILKYNKYFIFGFLFIYYCFIRRMEKGDLTSETE